MPLIAIAKSPADMQLEFMEIGRSGEGMSLNERIDLATRLINEEVNEELMPAIDVLKRAITQANDITQLNGLLEKPEMEELLAAYTEVADGIVDSVYVLMQLCNTLGLPFDAMFLEVHRSNMSKFVEDPTNPGTLVAIKDAGGKIMKGPNFSKPSLRPLIAKAIFYVQEEEMPETEHVDHTQIH